LKIALQSKADDPRMCVFSYAHSTFLPLWPWPWTDDLDIRNWPRYPEDARYTYTSKMNFLSQGFQKLRAQTGQTDTQTHTRPSALSRHIRRW